MPPTFHPELVPAWAKVVAWLVPLTVLPSAVWRVTDWFNGIVLGRSPCHLPTAPLWEKIYVPSVSVVSLCLALLTIGLIRPWGEVFPRWLPWIGGRGIPVAFPVTAATIGAVLVLTCGGRRRRR